MWPPLSDAGARAAASILLAAVGLLIWLARKRRAPMPTEGERTQLAAGVRQLVYRRFNSGGSVDDILAVGWVLLAYGWRSAGATAPDAGEETPA